MLCQEVNGVCGWKHRGTWEELVLSSTSLPGQDYCERGSRLAAVLINLWKYIMTLYREKKKCGKMSNIHQLNLISEMSFQRLDFFILSFPQVPCCSYFSFSLAVSFFCLIFLHFSCTVLVFFCPIPISLFFPLTCLFLF